MYEQATTTHAICKYSAHTMLYTRRVCCVHLHHHHTPEPGHPQILFAYPYTTSVNIQERPAAPPYKIPVHKYITNSGTCQSDVL
jgi:hypothetical protein